MDNLNPNRPFGTEFLEELPYKMDLVVGGTDCYTTYQGTAGGDNSTTDDSDGCDTIC